MMRWISMLVLVAMLLAAQATFADPIGPGKSGQESVNFLRSKFRPASTLSYKQARQKMFSEIDNENGKVRCVYTISFRRFPK